MATATIGEKVKILTCEGEIDPNTYEVMDLQKALVVLKCAETDQTIKVHNSRIIENTENIMTTDAASTESTKIASDIASAMVSKKETKQELEKIDFDALIEEGYEVWTKENLKFDQNGFEVKAHCIISPDKTKYETFNSYNGSRGKNNSKMKKGEPRKRTFYNLANEEALKKKRATLQKKGYTRQL